MNDFDIAISSFPGYPGYIGNPPSNEDEYNQLEWRSDWSKPAWENLQTEIAKISCQHNRAAEYPSIGDQLDALWKGGDAAAEMLAKVQAVKVKYPKGVA